MRLGGLALLSALSSLPGSAHAGDYITPTTFGDFVAFTRFAVADGRCPSMSINYAGTVSQRSDLARLLASNGLRRVHSLEKQIELETLIAASLTADARASAEWESVDDLSVFCLSVWRLFNSYDPAHLRTVGVID